MSGAKTTPKRSGLTLASTAVVAVLLLAVPVVGLAALMHGTAGAAGAGAGLSLVLILFGAAALIQAWAARLSPQAWAAAVGAGFGGRLLVYTLVLAALSRVETLHWPSLALATAVGLAGTLAAELGMLARRPEFFWVQPRAKGVDR